MAYYRGDYYRGDYYRGDFWGGLVGGIKGFATGGIGGAVAGAITGSRGGGQSGPANPPQAPGIHIPGFSTPFSIPGFGSSSSTPAPGMKGYHLNKSNEYNPGAHKQIVVPKHTKWVKNRHMNVANPRALARAARRAHGFLRLSSKFVRYYHPHKAKGRAYIGKRKRSR